VPSICLTLMHNMPSYRELKSGQAARLALRCFIGQQISNQSAAITETTDARESSVDVNHTLTSAEEFCFVPEVRSP
jgi:hypothetical protein